MKLLNKLPNSVRAAPDLEWSVLKMLPVALVAGTLLPLAVSLSNRFMPPEGTAAENESYLKMVDILSIAMTVTIWMAAFTIAIGCVVVVVMKGPAYVADAYELEDSDHPAPRP
jgi:hypothetical protein